MGLERPIPDEKEWSLASEIFSLPGALLRGQRDGRRCEKAPGRKEGKP